MVARIIRLQLTLLGRVFRGRPLAVVRRVAWGALAIGSGALLAVAPLGAPAPEREILEVLVGAAVLVFAATVPFFANRRHLEPRQFRTMPLTAGQISTGLLAAGALSWPGLWVAWWVLVSVAVRAPWQAVWWIALPAAVALWGLSILGARLASAAAKLVVTPSLRGPVRGLGWILALAAFPLAITAVAHALSPGGLAGLGEAASVVSWTPWGAPIAAVSLALSGETAAAWARLAIALGWGVVLAFAWTGVVRRSLDRVEAPQASGGADDGLGWFDRLPARPTSAIAARALTYWARDSRYRVGLIAVPLAPVGILLALWVAGVDPQILALVPLPIALLLLGWSLHNDVAMDSTALWMHIASGTRGRHDRLGRLAPVLLLGVPLLVVGSSLTVAVLGDWRVLPAVVGLNAGVLGVTLGVSSVMSAWLPYPAPRPGDSPFAQPATPGTGAGLAQTGSMLASLVLVVPPLWWGVASVAQPTLTGNLVALAFGIAYGCALLLVGVWIGGRRFDRAAPELLQTAQTFD